MDKSFDALFGVRGFIYFLFNVCNYCNLHCEHCSSLCHVPLGSESKYRFRKKKYEMRTEDAELFCKRFEGWGQDDYIRLTGGEATAIPTETLEEIIDILYSYDRKIWLMTNGYGLKEIDRRHLNHIDWISINNHGINEAHVWRLIKYLIRFYGGRYDVLYTKYHYDLRQALRHPENVGKGCSLWMLTPEIYDGVIYPCCNLDFVEAWNNITKVRRELVKAGWALYNEDVVETMRDWRETIPEYAVDQCLNHCWQPNIRIADKTRITLKPNDIISREGKE